MSAPRAVALPAKKLSSLGQTATWVRPRQLGIHSQQVGTTWSCPCGCIGAPMTPNGPKVDHFG